MDETGVKLLLLLCRYNEQLTTSSCKKQTWSCCTSWHFQFAVNLILDLSILFHVCVADQLR